VTQPKLEVRHLTKTFSRGRGEVIPVLDDVSFAVADLEFVAIVDNPSADDPRDVEQLVDEVGLPRRVVEDRFDRAGRAGGIERARPQHRRPAEHGGQRRPELVRHDR